MQIDNFANKTTFNMDAANNYFVTFLKDGKVKEQHYCQTIEQVKTLQAVARSQNCTLDYVKLSPDDEDTKKKIEVQAKVDKTEESPKTRDGWCRHILCIETGTVFSSVTECSRHFQISYKSIWNAAHSGRERHGYHFQFTGDYSKQANKTKRRHTQPDKVEIQNLGLVFIALGCIK